MNRCPHCQARVNPLRLLLVTRWTPYQCPTCAQRFHRVLRPRSLLLYTAPIVPLLWVVLWFHFSLIALMFVGIGAVLISMVLDWLVMPWRRVDAQG
jgi:drug/metabolite transporter (DMT)-like permease